MSDGTGRSGRRLVVALALLVVAVAGVLGYGIGLVAATELRPRLLGVIPLPATPLGLAAYGSLTMGLVLGAGLAAVSLVSRLAARWGA